jgi:ribonuclease P protein subunit POP4
MKVRDVLKSELIGLIIEVTDATNQSLQGLKGKVVEETRNTLTIRDGDKEKKIVKEHVTITTTIDEKTIEIDGKLLVGRPEERLKKRR